MPTGEQHGGEQHSEHQVVVGLAIGVGAAVLGLLPWIVTGMRLPLQNLWSTPVTDPSDMPIALLPFNQYTATTIAAVLLVGGAAAGIAVRVLRGRRRLGRTGSIAALGGLVGLQLVALVESAIVTGAGLRMDGTPGTGADISAAQLYLAALVLGSLASIAVAVVLTVVIARAPAGGAVVALAVSALALGVWVDALVLPPTEIGDDLTTVLLRIVRWVPAVAVGVAIAWTGIRTIGQAVGAVVSLGVLWTGTAAITAVSAGLGTRVYLPYPVEMASYAGTVFVMAMGPAGSSLVPVVVAAVVGGLGATAVRWWTGRRRQVSSGSPAV